MFADPQSITVNSVAQTLPAISREQNKSVYRKDTGDYTLSISHQDTKNRSRAAIRVDARKIAANPFDTSKNEEFTCSVYIVVDRPMVGFTNVELKDIALGLTGWASSANLLKVLGYES